MQKKLTKHGNSHALLIDKAVLDLLKIEADTLLDITTDGKSLIVSRAETDLTRGPAPATVQNRQALVAD